MVKNNWIIPIAIVLITCVIVLVLFGGENTPTPVNNSGDSTANSEPISTQMTTSPDPIITEPHTSTTEPTDRVLTGDFTNGFLPEAEYIETINLANSVQIRKVATDPNEVIDAMPLVDSSHKEYIPYGDAAAAVSSEGKVYRNDRTISIDIYDRFYGDTYTFTFGYPTGECNRFLYLNPQVSVNGEPAYYLGESYQFNFNVGGDGQVVNFGGTPDEFFSENVSYNMIRHRSEDQVANFLDFQHPGSVWFTVYPLQEPAEIQVRIFTENGYLVGTLALIVEKDEAGTYAFTNIKNLDLWEDNTDYPNFTHNELEYITSIIQDALDNGEIVALSARFSDFDATTDRCVYVLRPKEDGFYYPTFVNIDPNGSDLCSYISSLMPYSIAVSLNDTQYWDSATIYLWIASLPTETERGIYQIIGCDYARFENASDVESPRLDF